MASPKVSVPAALVFYCALTALLFGRALNYEFVYDDHWRILRNPSVQQLQPVSRYFTNPETQAGQSMEGHTYRPLVTLIYAATHRFAGMKARIYRLENFVVHIVNATLVFVIGVHVIGLSGAAALFAGTLFLIHPLQIETVVWAAELSNALALTWILTALLLWRAFLRTAQIKWVFGVFALALIGFATRENSVTLVALLILLSAVPFDGDRAPRRKIIRILFALTVLTVSYVALRSYLLQRIGQGAMWGGSIATHLANVIQVWPLYLGRLLWPDDLRIIYNSVPRILVSPFHWRAIIGAFGFASYLILTFLVWKKNPRWGFPLAALGVSWLPGSGIVPLNTLFAERLLYPLIPCAGWAIGIVLERTSNRIAWWSAITALLALALVTTRQLPVWRHEESLWAHAVNIEPDSWFAWGSLANANELIAGNQADPAQIKHFQYRAQALYVHALGKNPTEEGHKMIVRRLEALREHLGGPE